MYYSANVAIAVCAKCLSIQWFINEKLLLFTGVSKKIFYTKMKIIEYQTWKNCIVKEDLPTPPSPITTNL